MDMAESSEVGKAEDGAAKKKPAAQRGRGGGGHLGPSSREVE